MTRLGIPEPFSGGIVLSYKCTNSCQHCMYACSPRWKADWISVDDAEKILTQLSPILAKKYPKRFDQVGVNLGVHFTGGEPFLNYSLLLNLTKIANRLEIPSTFVETNCFWCVDDEVTEEKLSELRNEGLKGILISANPFIVEQIPFERIERAIKISRRVFSRNVMIYHDLFYSQLKTLNVKGTLPFDDYLRLMRDKDPMSLHDGLNFPSILPMGRTPYKLGHLYTKYPAKFFFKDSCIYELTRDWHIHIDNYCNYITGYCAGISLGDARDIRAICRGIELDDYPIIGSLVSPSGIRELFELGVKEFRYKELEEGYVSKCHLCVDVRRNIVEQTDGFKELKPREFYHNLMD